jgi:Flp pilus assembly protein TadD
MLHELFRECFAALVYDDLEGYEETIQALTDHLAVNPANAAALNKWGVAFWEIGQPDRALEDCNRAAPLARDNPLPAKNRGMLL